MKPSPPHLCASLRNPIHPKNYKASETPGGQQQQQTKPLEGDGARDGGGRDDDDGTDHIIHIRDSTCWRKKDGVHMKQSELT